MEADFDRYYSRDLGALIWREGWPCSKLLARILALPEDSAWRRKRNEGHTTLHEILAQVRDAVVTTAHGWRLEGKPGVYPRPGQPEPREDDGTVDLTNPADVATITRFFGRPRR